MAEQLQAFAGSHGLHPTGAIRVLLVRALNAEADRADSPASLAGLTAAEHAVLMVASILPEGRRRMQELASEATVAAEQRLALFREAEP